MCFNAHPAIIKLLKEPGTPLNNAYHAGSFNLVLSHIKFEHNIITNFEAAVKQVTIGLAVVNYKNYTKL